MTFFKLVTPNPGSLFMHLNDFYAELFVKLVIISE